MVWVVQYLWVKFKEIKTLRFSFVFRRVSFGVEVVNLFVLILLALFVINVVGVNFIRYRTCCLM